MCADLLLGESAGCKMFHVIVTNWRGFITTFRYCLSNKGLFFLVVSCVAFITLKECKVRHVGFHFFTRYLFGCVNGLVLMGWLSLRIWFYLSTITYSRFIKGLYVTRRIVLVAREYLKHIMTQNIMPTFHFHIQGLLKVSV